MTYMPHTCILIRVVTIKNFFLYDAQERKTYTGKYVAWKRHLLKNDMQRFLQVYQDYLDLTLMEGVF